MLSLGEKVNNYKHRVENRCVKKGPSTFLHTIVVHNAQQTVSTIFDPHQKDSKECLGHLFQLKVVVDCYVKECTSGAVLAGLNATNLEP